jgi:hypothetical protein
VALWDLRRRGFGSKADARLGIRDLGVRVSATGGKRPFELTYPVRQSGDTMAAVRESEFYFPCETNIDSPKRNAPTTMMSAPA